MSDAPGSFDGLPEVLREIAEVAGLEAAMKLAWQHGGTEVRIPRKVGAKHWLVTCVGKTAADRICDHFQVRDADGRPIGNFRVLIPLAGTGVMAQAKRKLVQELRAGNLSVRAAARKCGLHERTGWRVKAQLQHPGTDVQPDLFAQAEEG